MTYRDVLTGLFALRRMGVKLELDRMRAALHAVGDPHEALRFVHLAGTNGKGSTAAFLEAMLRAGGYRAGLFTSPHLSRFTERIRIAGQEIAPSEIVRLEAEIRRRVDVPLTFFEVVTLLGLMAFRDHGADPVVLETGLGGRFDATNVVTPEVAVITGIALDHVEYLGPTLAAIAFEKAGILKPRRPAVAAAPLAAAAVIAGVAADRRAPLWLLGRDFDLAPLADGGVRVSAPGRPPMEAPLLGLRGPHQRRNAGLALMAAALLDERGIALPEAARRQGLAACRWPGRLEELGAAPRIWVDGAHNPDGAAALAAALAEVPRRRLTLCLGVLGDKDAAGVLAPLRPLADRLLLVTARSPRALPAAELRRLAPEGEAVPLLEQAVARVRATAAPDDLCVIAGSLYLAGEARELLLGEIPDPVAIGDPVGLAAG
ncbi:MAG TPA: folylpolyglutamate synthase/dihydrofolate synthase family protein [Polyangia bacterium]|jgi:dihydrofolate synthase/folylpolyglutamate synthase